MVSETLSKLTQKRIEKQKQLGLITEDKAKELLRTMTLSDDELKKKNSKIAYTKEDKKDYTESIKQKDSIDKQRDDQQAIYDKNQKVLFAQKPELPEEIKNMSTGKAIRRILSILRTMKKRHPDYEKEKLSYTPKALETVRTIEDESGNKVQCIVDKEFVDVFRKIQGVGYRGGAIMGKYVIVDDMKALEDETFLRHEAIHCAQQRDMGGGRTGNLGFIRWLGASITSTIKLQFFGDVKGLSDAVDYGTDNQYTDRETYMNQFSKGYLKTRHPFAHKKYKNWDYVDTRQQELNKEEHKRLKDTLETAKKTGDSVVLQEAEMNLNQFEKMMEQINKEREVRVVMIRPDLPGDKKEDTEFQVKTETASTREKRIPIEQFIQKHGKEQDNYKSGVELRIALQETIAALSSTRQLTEKQQTHIRRDIQHILNTYEKKNKKSDLSEEKILEEKKSLIKTYQQNYKK